MNIDKYILIIWLVIFSSLTSNAQKELKSLFFNINVDTNFTSFKKYIKSDLRFEESENDYGKYNLKNNSDDNLIVSSSNNIYPKEIYTPDSVNIICSKIIWPCILPWDTTSVITINRYFSDFKIANLFYNKILNNLLILKLVISEDNWFSNEIHKTGFIFYFHPRDLYITKEETISLHIKYSQNNSCILSLEYSRPNTKGKSQ